MKYMLLVYLDEQVMSEAEREHCYVESARLAQDSTQPGNIWMRARCIRWRRRRAFACAMASGW